MKFPYWAYRGFFKPIVPVIVGYGNREISTIALVDSGADTSLFDLSIAQALEIDFANVVPRKIGGIGGLVKAFLAAKPTQPNFCKIELNYGARKL